MSRAGAIFATGVVVAIDAAKVRARVRFDDLDGMVSYWLRVPQTKTHQDKHYDMPDINEHVGCILDEHAEDGMILAAVYSNADTPPVSSADKHHVTFSDGTVIEYDRSTHKLFADVKGDVEVKVTGLAKIVGDLRVEGNINATGNIIDGGANTNHHSHT